MLSYVAMHSKQHKTTKVIKLQWLASIWCQNILNYKSDQNTKTCIDFMSNRSKQLKTTKAIKLQCIASIWRQNDQKSWVTSQNIPNNAKLRKWSKYNDLHRFHVKTIKNVAFRRKTFERTLNYKSNQITTICIDLTSKRSKILSYVAKHSKQRKTTKVIKLQWIASIWRQNDQKCWVKSQNIQNNAKLRKWSNYNELHRFDVITIKNVELRRKTFKTTQNYKSDHITMNLHRFHVKTIKTTQNYKNDQITMNCIDLTS